MTNSHFNALALAAELARKGADIATHLMDDITFEDYRFSGLDNSPLALSKAISVLTDMDAAILERDLNQITADYL